MGSESSISKDCGSIKTTYHYQKVVVTTICTFGVKMPKQLAAVSTENKFKIELSSITQVKTNKLTLHFHS